jgi:hypothetical protein
MYKILSLFLVFLFFTQAGLAYDIELSEQEISWIGERIFANECSSKNELLVQWNDGEDFLSLGIGHFIWYPKGVKGPFSESFPDFLLFAKISGANIPSWLKEDFSQPCPWQDKNEFLKSQEDRRLTELRSFLENTKPLQADFIVKRFNSSLSLMLENISDITQKHRVKRQLEWLFSTAKGTYALIDYANFKGMGILSSERYNGEGWGLLQVLSGMKDEETAPDAVKEFSRSADRVLTRRVDNSPVGRNEQQWLPGWRNRVKTYQ